MSGNREQDMSPGAATPRNATPRTHTRGTDARNTGAGKAGDPRTGVLAGTPQAGTPEAEAPRAGAPRTGTAAGAPRRRLLAAAAFAPLLAGVGMAGTGLAGPGAATAHADTRRGGGPVPPDHSGHPPGPDHSGHGRPLKPVRTKAGDWDHVVKALELSGDPSMVRGEFFHARFPRTDLDVVSYGVKVSTGLALGSHVAFVRYEDGSTLVMGDLVCAENELQRVSDALFAHHIEMTALHKHLLAHSPDVWWIHIHAHGHDAVALARGVRAAIDRTATPAPQPRPRSLEKPPLDLDTRRIDAALGGTGSNDGGLYKIVFHRRETIVDRGMELPQGLGASTAFNMQLLGGGRVALSGDFVMVADEVPKVLARLRQGKINLVELHNHGLSEEPRLFFTHIWAVGDGVRIARALRPALDATRVTPGGQGGGD
ncbi:DUF1259 domain-containing protein [Streptomyces sp. NPDC095613]|uniref:DUF1259 domain-containing protein n=1 Tax=Streptomyces sp. NPDC095613 TaxID=3155540 RepID=UPI0033190F93